MNLESILTLLAPLIWLIIEYSLFTSNRFEKFIPKLLSFLTPILAALIVYVSYTFYYGTTPNKFLSTVILTTGAMIVFSKIILSSYFNFFRYNRLSYFFNIFHKIPQLPWWTVLPWIFPMIVSGFMLFSSDRNTIIILPITNGNGQSVLKERLDVFFERMEEQNVYIQASKCFFDCPSPKDIVESNPRVLAVISGASVQNGTDEVFHLRIDRQCNLLVSVQNIINQPVNSCTSNETLSSQIADIDIYLPIIMLTSISLTEDNIPSSIMSDWIKKAVSNLRHVHRLTSRDEAWATYENLFYTILFEIPSRNNNERRENVATILEIAEQTYGQERRYKYLNARYYEEFGIIINNNYDQAISEYQDLLLENPRDTHSLNGLSRVSMRLQRFADTVCYTNESLKIDPNNNTNQLTLARALQELGTDLISTGLENSTSTPEDIRNQIIANVDARSVNQNLRLALVAFDNRDYDTALNYIETVKEFQSINKIELAYAYFIEGKIYLAKDNYRLAVNSFEQFLRESDTNFDNESIAQVHQLIGRSYHSWGYHDRAILSYQRSLELATNENERFIAITNLARQFILNGEYQNASSETNLAQGYYSSLHENISTSAKSDYLQMLYQNAISNDRDPNRIKYLEQVVEGYTFLIDQITENAKDDFSGCEWLGNNFYENENSYDYLRSFIENPVVPTRYYQNRRFANDALGRNNEAYADAEREIQRLEVNSRSAADYYNLGYAYIGLKRYEDALAALEKAVTLDNPDVVDDIADATDYHLMGICYDNLERYEEAIDAYQKAIELQPNNLTSAGSYVGLSHVYLKLENFQDAINARKNALERRSTEDITNRYRDIIFIGDTYQKTALSSRHHESIQIWHQALDLELSEGEQIELWRKIATTYREWAEEDSEKFTESVFAWRKAIDIGSFNGILRDSNRSNPKDWLELGITYRSWGEETGDDEAFRQSIFSFQRCIDIDAPESIAAYWYHKGLTYRKWAKYDATKYVDAINAWEEAITNDNPEETALGTDIRDIADYVQIAETYIEWSKIDPSKLPLIDIAINDALSITISPDDRDYHWHEHALHLKENYLNN